MFDFLKDVTNEIHGIKVFENKKTADRLLKKSTAVVFVFLCVAYLIFAAVNIVAFGFHGIWKYIICGIPCIAAIGFLIIGKRKTDIMGLSVFLFFVLMNFLLTRS
jgi:predicted exporter